MRSPTQRRASPATQLLPDDLVSQTKSLQQKIFPALVPVPADAAQLLAALEARTQALAQEIQSAMSSQLPGGFSAFKVLDGGKSQALEAL